MELGAEDNNGLSQQACTALADELSASAGRHASAGRMSHNSRTASSPYRIRVVPITVLKASTVKDVDYKVIICK